MQKTNKVVRISYSGGLIGLIFGSARGKLSRVLDEQNGQGWNLAEIMADNPNLLIWILRLAILVVTLGLWTLSNSYLLVLERPAAGTNAKQTGRTLRTEPSLSAQR